MASIYRRGKTWSIAHYVVGRTEPVRRSLKTTSKRIAEREKQALDAEFLHGYRRVPEEKNPTLDEFWREHLSWAESGHLRPRTVERKKDFWSQFRDFVGHNRLGDATPRDIEASKRWRRRLGSSLTTINKALTDLQAIYSRATKLGLYTGVSPFERHSSDPSSGSGEIRAMLANKRIEPDASRRYFRDPSNTYGGLGFRLAR